MRHFATTIIGALTLYAISPSGLAAAAPDGARQVTVKFYDLDLTRLAGAQELYRRIEHAARDVCDPYASGRYVLSMPYRDCKNQAIRRAVADVDAPLLTARYQALTGRQILRPQQTGLNR